MPYVTRPQIETEIPALHLKEALDDDSAGGEDQDLFEAVAQQASDAVDGFLAARYPTPFADPAPPAVKQAAFVFCGELIYARRGVRGDDNPFTKRAESWREMLTKMGAGKLPLDATIIQAFTPGAVISETAAIDATTR